MVVLASMYYGFKIGFKFGIRYVEVPIESEDDCSSIDEITLRDCSFEFVEISERDEQLFAVYRNKLKGEL